MDEGCLLFFSPVFGAAADVRAQVSTAASPMPSAAPSDRIDVTGRRESLIVRAKKRLRVSARPQGHGTSTAFAPRRSDRACLGHGIGMRTHGCPSFPSRTADADAVRSIRCDAHAAYAPVVD